MTDHRLILELDFGRETAEKPGAAGRSAVTTIPVAGPFVAHPDGAGGLLGRIPGWAGWEPVTATIEVAGGGVDPDDAALLEAYQRQAPAWFIWTGLGPCGFFANAPRQPIVAEYAITTNGTRLIEPAIQLDGAAETQVGAPTGFSGTITMRRLFAANTTGQLLVGDFAAPAELGATTADLGEVVASRLQQLAFPRTPVSLGLDSQGDPELVYACKATFSDPWSRVWVGPSDIGLAVDQIPDTLREVTAARLRHFPSIFVRRTEYVRGVRAPGPASSQQVNQVQSAPCVLVTQRSPTHSRWRLWVDGRLAEVVVAHEVGSDWRTPKQVWNGLFARFVLSAEVTTPFPTYRVVTDGVLNTFHQQGVIGRNGFLEAAEFAEFYDSNAEDPISVQEVLVDV
jgi:hypothetical protein